jgi:hypothetical protein
MALLFNEMCSLSSFRCIGRKLNVHGNFAFDLVVKLSVELGYVFTYIQGVR